MRAYSVLQKSGIVYAALDNVHDEGVRSTLNADHTNAQIKVQTRALQVAAKSGDLDAARAAVKKCACLDEPDKAELTPLQRAAMRADESMVGYLLEAGASVDLGGEDQREALSFASAHRGGARIVEKLLTARAKVDATDHAGRSALSYAVSAGAADCVIKLLAKGAHSNFKDKVWDFQTHFLIFSRLFPGSQDGKTALNRATETAKPEDKSEDGIAAKAATLEALNKHALQGRWRPLSRVSV